MRRRAALVLGSLAIGLVPLSASAAVGADGDGAGGRAAEYVVLFDEGIAQDDASAAVAAAAGRLTQLNTAVAVGTAASDSDAFPMEVAAQAGVVGVARKRPMGTVPPGEKVDPAELDPRVVPHPAPLGPAEAPAPAAGEEPLAPLQWDMRMMNATPSGSYATQQGDPGVVVAVIDTGIDGSHPDIAPNFDAGRSRNFTVDIPLVDGACEEEADQACTDPADVDEQGHGTHVASTIASPLNGLGIGGVAPQVTVVSARAGQDSGYFFLQPTVDALVYAADIGADVVNMSFFVDPWLFNCADNPADSPFERLEQRTIIAATQRALDYAHRHGATLVSSAGNNHTDLGHPEVDTASPNFPPGAARQRQVDDSCLVIPTEADRVIAVTAVGPSTRKAYYSNYGVQQADVSAPGGDYRDFPGTELTERPQNLILGAYPAAVAAARGQLDEDGSPNTPFVVRDCRDGECAYYQWIQGTSMAAPHAAGVAALIVSEYGRTAGDGAGGLTLAPGVVERVLLRTATDRPCPEPRLLEYPDPIPESFDALCEGRFSRNGFYGEGIVDAARAVNHYYGPGRPDVR